MDNLLILGYWCSAFMIAVFGAAYFVYDRITGEVLGLAPGVFWPYFVGMCLFTLGLIAIDRKELSRASGVDKMLPFGRVFFAVPMAVFGAQHFTAARFVMNLVPSWMPGHLFWTYFVGTALIAATINIVSGKPSRLAATLLGVMLVLFVLLLHIPTFLGSPSDRIKLAVVLRDLSFSGGAFALAGIQTETWRKYGTNKIITIARYLISIPVVFFGVENLLHPEFAPSVPLNKITPTWMPAHLFWGYPVGLVFVAAGLSLVFKKNDRAAATWLGIVVLFVVLFFYLPIVIAIPLDVGNSLNYLVDTLALSGGALLLADAPRNRSSASEASLPQNHLLAAVEGAKQRAG
jgi:uncharacterized membrane protein